MYHTREKRAMQAVCDIHCHNSRRCATLARNRRCHTHAVGGWVWGGDSRSTRWAAQRVSTASAATTAASSICPETDELPGSIIECAGVYGRPTSCNASRKNSALSRFVVMVLYLLIAPPCPYKSDITMHLTFPL